jgi:hypothetical protein
VRTAIYVFGSAAIVAVLIAAFGRNALGALLRWLWPGGPGWGQ